MPPQDISKYLEVNQISSGPSSIRSITVVNRVCPNNCVPFPNSIFTIEHVVLAVSILVIFVLNTSQQVYHTART